MIDLGNAQGGTAYPYAISDAGQVVGAASLSSGTGYAFLWTKAGGMVNLGSRKLRLGSEFYRRSFYKRQGIHC